jgi:hypothetical protein
MKKNRIKASDYNSIIDSIPVCVFEDFILKEIDSAACQKYILQHKDSGILFSSFLCSLRGGMIPNIISCLDKTAYFKYLLSKRLPGYKLIDEYCGELKKIDVITPEGDLLHTYPSKLSGKYIPTFKSCKDGGTGMFIRKAKIVHNNKYSYEKCIYKAMGIKLTISCDIHGDFIQTAQSHINGNGCPICASELNSSGFGRTDWVNKGMNSRNIDSFKVYIIRCFGNGEDFIKIGRSYTKLYDRFRLGNSNQFPYEYKIVELIEGDGFYIYDLEIYLHRKLFSSKYIPKSKFNGMNECFSIDILDSYKNIVKEFDNERKKD